MPVTISNLSSFNHPPPLISLFTSYLFSFSPPNPFLSVYYAMAFTVPLIPSLPFAPYHILHPLLIHTLESFCIFSGLESCNCLCLRERLKYKDSTYFNTQANNCLHLFLLPCQHSFITYMNS